MANEYTSTENPYSSLPSNNSTLQIQEQSIKKEFDILKDKQLFFNFVSADRKSEKIESKNIEKIGFFSKL